MKNIIKKLIKTIIPNRLLRWRQNKILQKELAIHDENFKNKSPGEIFSNIYKNKLWGGVNLDYYSGHGSSLAAHVEPYVKSVSDFLGQFSKPMDVVDLGCGDFSVGSQIRSHAGAYIACDVVSDLIERNRIAYSSSNVDFRVLDIVNDALPHGNVVIIRQVLQHLCNAEIIKVLKKLNGFSYLVLTEFLPNGNFIPNVDQPTGSFSRLARGIQSGIIVTAEPFCLPVKKEKLICETPEGPGSLKVIVYELV